MLKNGNNFATGFSDCFSFFLPLAVCSYSHKEKGKWESCSLLPSISEALKSKHFFSEDNKSLLKSFSKKKRKRSIFIYSF